MKKYLPLLFITLGLVLNMFFLKNIFVGSILTLLYFGVIGFVNADSIERGMGIQNKIVKYVLGVGVSLLLFGFLLSLAVVWYKLPLWLLALYFIIFPVLCLGLREKLLYSLATSENMGEISVFGIFPRRKFVFFCFFVISFLQVLILYLCRTTEGIESPWQVVHSWYLYNFFLLTFLLFVLLLSRVSSGTKLLCILLYSLVLHIYLPLIHTQPWGGDVWRLMGVEGKLLSGAGEPPFLPTAFINPYKYTYGQMWGMATAISASSRISLLEIHRWGMAILWGVMLPALFFAFGKKLFVFDRFALFFSFLSTFPFAFQAIGSITVAVSFGFLSFLFGLLLLFSYFEDQNSLKKKLCFGFGFLMIFGYALFAILYWLVFGFFFLIQKYSEKKHFDFKKLSSVQKFFAVAMLILLVGLFPLIDAFVGKSYLISNFSLFSSIKQGVGQFLGWYFVRPIGQAEIASANIFFNHMHLSSYVKNIFTTLRFPVMFALIALFAFVLRGVYVSMREKKNIVLMSLFSLLLCILGGYSIGWYFLGGERIFVRRLDAPLALLLLFFCFCGILSFDCTRFIKNRSHKKVLSFVFVGIFVYSFIATSIYASGPDIRVVSAHEYAAAQYIVNHQKDEELSCVLADTWILLPIEGLSKGSLVGGGFPIGANFAQAERVSLYNEFLKNPDSRILQKIASIVSAKTCFVVVSQKDIDSRKEVLIHGFFGNAVAKFGDILIWKIDLKK